MRPKIVVLPWGPIPEGPIVVIHDGCEQNASDSTRDAPEPFLRSSVTIVTDAQSRHCVAS